MHESMTETGRGPRVRVPISSLRDVPAGWPEDEPTPAGVIPMGGAEGYEGWEIVVVELPEPEGDAYVLDCGPVARLAHQETYCAKTDELTKIQLMKTRVELRDAPWEAVAAALVAATDATTVAPADDVPAQDPPETVEGSPADAPAEDDAPATRGDEEPAVTDLPVPEEDEPSDEELEEALMEEAERPLADGLMDDDDLFAEGLALVDAARD